MGELLVIGITWWYTYQSYRIRKGIDLGRTVSSLLVYNGKQPCGSPRLSLTFKATRKLVFHVGFPNYDAFSP